MEKEDKENIPKNRKWYVWLFIALLCALLISSFASDALISLFNSLLSGITPILIGMIIAFLLIEPVNLIENKMLKNAFVGNPHAKGLKRAISLAICYFVIIGLIVLIFILVIPSMKDLIEKFQAEGGAYWNNISLSIQQLLSNLVGSVRAGEIVNDAAQSILTSLQEWLTNFLSKNSGTFIVDTISAISNILLGLFVSFFLVKDKELIAKTFKRYTYAYKNKKAADETVLITRRSHYILNQCVLSNIIVMAIIFVLAWIGYAIIGVPFAALNALCLGVLSMIPYIGGFIAAIPLILIMVVVGTEINFTLMLIAFIYGIVVWALVTTFVPPIVMSKRLHIRAVVMTIGLIIGGALFGVLGMLLAAPTVGVISIIMQERLEVRESQREREEIIESGEVALDEVGTSDMLDLTEDKDVNVLAPRPDETIKRKPKKSKKIE